jgi:hypothetical protein
VTCPHKETIEVTTYQDVGRGVQVEMCRCCGLAIERPLIDCCLLEETNDVGFIDRVKQSKIGGEAERAVQEGRTVFLARINVGVTDAGASGTVTGAAEIIESIEAVGWRLDQMSYAQDRKGSPEGYYLFRRSGY